MNYNNCFISLVCIYLFSFNLYAQTNQWTFAIYMESSDDLQAAAIKNLNEMALISPEHARIFVLLHANGANAWLYEISKHTLKQIGMYVLQEDVTENIFYLMNYSVNQAPANHYCLVLWNHGYGILKPFYNKESKEWELLPDGDAEVICPIKRSSHQTWSHRNHKGMLCNAYDKTCMDNEQMVNTFERISNEILDGKKIDICGLDMCKGAMFEHAYQLRHYINYLIGSQECELLDGWPYDLILQKLVDEPNVAPRKLAEHVIDAYSRYYKQHAPVGLYTQSAMDIKYTEQLKENIDAVANLLCKGIEHHTSLHDLIHKARKECTIICDAPMYVDIYEFYHNILTLLESEKDSNCPVTSQLKQLVSEGCSIIKKMVVGNCIGSQVEILEGISIYFPQYVIDPSYKPALFAQESTWINLLEKLIQ